VAIAVLALWLATEEGATWQRLALLGPLVALTYLLHFFAFVVLALAAFGREAQRLLSDKGQFRSALRRGLVVALPFVLPVAWLARDVLTAPESPAGSYTRARVWKEWIDVVGSLALAPMDGLGTGLNLTGGLVVALLVPMLATLLRPGSVRLRLAPTLVGPAIAVAAGVALAPSCLDGVAWVHVRLPFVLVLILIAGSRWEGLAPRSAPSSWRLSPS